MPAYTIVTLACATKCIQMLSQGWTVRRMVECQYPRRTGARTTDAEPVREETVPDAPILVHRCSDEETLTAAARYLVRSGEGENVVTAASSINQRATICCCQWHRHSVG